MCESACESTSTIIDPDGAESNFATQRARVLLPDPFAPSKAAYS
jgi:hypothetical protein